ncbi:hypothetical protein GCM10010363_56800 [Streptomyces omiyaensis]|nr:hypothetical protein GCM10010363_56800 [Streptomyces omiyaensis]
MTPPAGFDRAPGPTAPVPGPAVRPALSWLSSGPGIRRGRTCVRRRTQAPSAFALASIAASDFRT